MKEYNDESDEQLILRLRDGESDITDYIMDKYKHLVKSKARAMFILGADGDDLIQEGMIGLFKAIRDYDIGRDASFFTFAELCISRQMYTAVQASGRKKHAPLNTYISLYGDRDGGSEDDSDMRLINALASAIDKNPEEIMIDRENFEDLLEMIEKELSVFEMQVLELRLTGMNYIDIAKVLGRDEKSTDNALSRIKQKIKKTYIENQKE